MSARSTLLRSRLSVVAVVEVVAACDYFVGRTEIVGV
jgi:hypothetical protein